MCIWFQSLWSDALELFICLQGRQVLLRANNKCALPCQIMSSKLWSILMSLGQLILMFKQCINLHSGEFHNFITSLWWYCILYASTLFDWICIMENKTLCAWSAREVPFPNMFEHSVWVFDCICTFLKRFVRHDFFWFYINQCACFL